MFFGDAAFFSNAFCIHPQAPQHACRVDTVTEGLQPLRKTLPIHLPVAHRLPPVALWGGVPTGVDEEDLGADLRRRVNGVVDLLDRDLDLRTDARTRAIRPGRALGA